MIVWALTGPIGSGKSAASGILAARGAAIVDGDKLGHELLARPEIQREISTRLGAEYVTNGVVARDRLGALVFNDPSALAILNEITHGPLGTLAREKIAALAAAGEHELAVFEAAVYFLLPSPPTVDLVVVVTASPEVRTRRLVERSSGRLSGAEARARVAAQEALAAQWQGAAEIIVNDGTRDELEARILRLVARARPGSETLP